MHRNSYVGNMDLAPQTVEALAQVISGGSGNETSLPIGIYRSGPKLESFMRACGVMMTIGSGSRVPTLTDALIGVMQRDEPETLRNIIERAADPRDFVHEPEKLLQVIKYLNGFLIFDQLELQRHGTNVKLMKAGTSTPVLAALAQTIQTIDFDTVRRDLDRALESVERDPEDAVTAACSIVESVCRSILIELKLPLPDKRDIQGLYRAVRKPLGLATDRDDLPAEIADDVRAILGALSSAVHGIGALRTHAGDAHGRERGFRRIDARIARLAIHSAGAVALFMIETWQRLYATKPLIAH